MPLSAPFFRAVDLVGDARKGVVQALLDQRDGEVRDVDPDPLPPELLRGMDGRAAAAEGVEHDVGGVAGCLDDALEESEGFLGRVTKTLF
jgi:hypothetical protein